MRAEIGGDDGMTTQDWAVRTMTEGDLALLLDWAAAEGWNPGLGDAACFHATDPGGFLFGTVDGEPVASISVVRYGAGFGFLGFYIARPGWRGRGFGFRLWQAGMARLDGRVIGLDGVVAQQANYAKSGYALAHRNVRWGGAATASATAPGIVAADALPAERLLAWDRPYYPAPRDAFLSGWLGTAGHAARVLLRDGEIAGWGVVRPCRDGHRIGPLVAVDEAGAEALFGALAAVAAPGPVFLDAPEPNGAAAALARRHGLVPTFETARMYRGPDPALPLGHIYGITSLELG